MEYLSESLLTPPMPWASEPEPLISEETKKANFTGCSAEVYPLRVIETLHYTRVPKALEHQLLWVLPHHQFNIIWLVEINKQWTHLTFHLKCSSLCERNQPFIENYLQVYKKNSSSL